MPHVANVTGLDYKVEGKQHNKTGRHKRVGWELLSLFEACNESINVHSSQSHSLKRAPRT